jgi:ribosomal protein S17E
MTEVAKLEKLTITLKSLNDILTSLQSQVQDVLKDIEPLLTPQSLTFSKSYCLHIDFDGVTNLKEMLIKVSSRIQELYSRDSTLSNYIQHRSYIKVTLSAMFTDGYTHHLTTFSNDDYESNKVYVNSLSSLRSSLREVVKKIQNQIDNYLTSNQGYKLEYIKDTDIKFYKF